MPELVEVERYRGLAEPLVGSRISSVDVVDPLMVRGGRGPAELEDVICGRVVTGVRRHGKLLLFDTGGRGRRDDEGPTFGIRFGMTGALVVDGQQAIDRLLYSSARLGPQWVRFRMGLRGPRGQRRELVLHDPRRLGGVELDPAEELLGPDAATVTVSQLRVAMGIGRPVRPGSDRRSGPVLKVRLMDQRRLAGVGNLIADEVLWRAGLAPSRLAAELAPVAIRRLHRHLIGTIDELLQRGGSHTGDLMGERRAGGRCPKDGSPLVRSTVGGRTSWWCPVHQR